MKTLQNVVRCGWARNDLAILYHDREWGVPQHDDRVLFEFLILEGAQAGLSWDTILKKRENYRAAFDGFDAKKIARYDRRKMQALMRDAGIVRNRLKITAPYRMPRHSWKCGKNLVRSTATSGNSSEASRGSTHGNLASRFPRAPPNPTR